MNFWLILSSIENCLSHGNNFYNYWFKVDVFLRLLYLWDIYSCNFNIYMHGNALVHIIYMEYDVISAAFHFHPGSPFLSPVSLPSHFQFPPRSPFPASGLLRLLWLPGIPRQCRCTVVVSLTVGWFSPDEIFVLKFWQNLLVYSSRTDFFLNENFHGYHFTSLQFLKFNIEIQLFKKYTFLKL